MYVCMYVKDLLRPVSIYRHLTRGPKFFIALSRLPVEGFSRNFAPRTQRSFATRVLKFVDSIQEVKEGTLHEKQCTFPPLSRLPAKDFQDGLHLACDSYAFHTL